MEKLYLARQPIVDINSRLVGYELLFRDTPYGIKQMPSSLLTTTIVLKNFLKFMISNTPDNVKIFINCDHTIILNTFIELLDPELFVVELLEDIEIDDNLIIKVEKLHQMGFEIAIDDFNCNDDNFSKFEKLLPYIKVVKICLQSMDITDSANYHKCCDNLRKYDITLLAEKVETLNELELCKRMGFELFQGYYIAKPEVFTYRNFDDVSLILDGIV